MFQVISSKVFIISILLLLTLGLIASGGLYYLLHVDTGSQGIKNYIPVTHKPSSFSLEINNPEDNIMVSDKNLVISGKTSPKSPVILTNGITSTGVDADANGNFSQVLTLAKGLNEITISSFDQDGNQKTENLNVYFSEEKL